MWYRSKQGLVLALTGIVLCAAHLRGQGVQAAAHLEHRRAGHARDSLVTLRNHALAYVASRELLERQALVAEGGEDPVYQAQVARVLAMGELLRRTPVGDPAVRELLNALSVEAASLESLSARDGSRWKAARLTVQAESVRTAWSWPGSLEPSVAFTLGLATPPCGSCGARLELGTNLLGSALGAAVGKLGAPDALKGYLEKNLALGLGVPTRKSARITSALSLGLGSVDAGSVSVWPALGIEQFDSSDTRIPDGVRARDQSQGTWSAPFFGVGVTWYDRATVRKRLASGKAVPILSLGVRLPHYYPGDASAALAALFSGKQDKYDGAGSARIFASPSLPLFKTSDK